MSYQSKDNVESKLKCLQKKVTIKARFLFNIVFINTSKTYFYYNKFSIYNNNKYNNNLVSISQTILSKTCTQVSLKCYIQYNQYIQ